MPGGTRKNTRRLTMCALSCALGVVIMSIGSLFESLDLSAAAFAGMLVVFIVIEIGGVWPWMVYAATGILSLLLPLKLAAVFYLVFIGYYPIVKEKIEKLKYRYLRWAVKLSLFLASLTAGVIITQQFLLVPRVGIAWYVTAYIFGTLAFVLFDIALSRLITIYLYSWRRKLRIDRLRLRDGIK